MVDKNKPQSLSCHSAPGLRSPAARSLALCLTLAMAALSAACSLEGDIFAVRKRAGICTVAFNANGATSGRAAEAM